LENQKQIAVELKMDLMRFSIKKRYVGQYKGTNLTRSPLQTVGNNDSKEQPSFMTVETIKQEIINCWEDVSRTDRIQIMEFLRMRCFQCYGVSKSDYENKSKEEKDEIDNSVTQLAEETRFKVCERFNRNYNTDYFGGINGNVLRSINDVPRAYWESVLREKILLKKLEKASVSIHRIGSIEMSRPLLDVQAEFQFLGITKTVYEQNPKHYDKQFKQHVKDVFLKNDIRGKTLDIELKGLSFQQIQSSSSDPLSVNQSSIHFNPKSIFERTTNIVVKFSNGQIIEGTFEPYYGYIDAEWPVIAGYICEKKEKHIIRVARFTHPL
jgi:hypothetical protein